MNDVCSVAADKRKQLAIHEHYYNVAHKTPPNDKFKFCCFVSKNMKFHDNRLLADNSHIISYLLMLESYVFRKLGIMSQKFVVCCSRDWR